MGCLGILRYPLNCQKELTVPALRAVVSGLIVLLSILGEDLQRGFEEHSFILPRHPVPKLVGSRRPTWRSHYFHLIAIIADKCFKVRLRCTGSFRHCRASLERAIKATGLSLSYMCLPEVRVLRSGAAGLTMQLNQSLAKAGFLHSTSSHCHCQFGRAKI